MTRWLRFDARNMAKQHTGMACAIPSGMTTTLKITFSVEPQHSGSLLSQLWSSARAGVLTTDHAASSHGLPVVVDDDGTVYGSAECRNVEAYTYVETDDEAGQDVHRALTAAERELLDDARRAGYDVRRAAPVTLDSLLDAMRSGTVNNWDSLPTFGGEEPENTQQVWSWDETRLIVGTCSDDVEIVERAEVL